MKVEESLKYNEGVLRKERKKQKILRIDIAQKLSLNELQIKSIEENLDTGFANNHFKKLSIKRYAAILAIPIDKVIPPSNNENNNFDTLNDKKIVNLKKYSLILPAALVLFLFANIFVFNLPEEEVDYVTLNDSMNTFVDPIPRETDENELPFETIENNAPSEIAQINLDSPSSDNVVLDFICTIDTTTDLTNFSTKNPEKPATYFFIISYEAQTFCTVDSNNILKTYNLAKGEKITHRGAAPFKIQLDPTISEIYFEGWKVQLQNDDFFIKLHPGKINNLN
jgi:hypothetical protein